MSGLPIRRAAADPELILPAVLALLRIDVHLDRVEQILVVRPAVLVDDRVAVDDRAQEHRARRARVDAVRMADGIFDLQILDQPIWHRAHTHESDERRVGKGWVSTGRTAGAAQHKNKNKKKK